MSACPPNSPVFYQIRVHFAPTARWKTDHIFPKHCWFQLSQFLHADVRIVAVL